MAPHAVRGLQSATMGGEEIANLIERAQHQDGSRGGIAVVALAGPIERLGEIVVVGGVPEQQVGVR